MKKKEYYCICRCHKRLEDDFVFLFLPLQYFATELDMEPGMEVGTGKGASSNVEIQRGLSSK